jgi:ABC-type Fe3+/spermidine/putrescine transport system ATPase subunit
VALARAVIKKPKVLLLDEPLAALDRKLREQTQFELVNIQESLGLTFVIVTHDQDEAMTVSTRIAIMDRGRTVQIGTPGETYEYPNSLYVARFLGDVNVFEGRVVEAGKDHVRAVEHLPSGEAPSVESCAGLCQDRKSLSVHQHDPDGRRQQHEAGRRPRSDACAHFDQRRDVQDRQAERHGIDQKAHACSAPSMILHHDNVERRSEVPSGPSESEPVSCRLSTRRRGRRPFSSLHM